MWGRTKYAFPFLTEKKKKRVWGGLETSIYSLKSRLTEKYILLHLVMKCRIGQTEQVRASVGGSRRWLENSGMRGEDWEAGK